MKKFIFILLFTSLYASIVDDFLNKKYNEICMFNNITKYSHNENILSLIGISCVKVDRLYLLPSIINKLKHTKEGMQNAIYFLTIYSQKKLLYGYFFYNLDLNNFDFPLTDYIISKVFYSIKRGNFEKDKDKFVIHFKDEKFLVYTQQDKLIIEEYKNNKLIKRHWYR